MPPPGKRPFNRPRPDGPRPGDSRSGDSRSGSDRRPSFSAPRRREAPPESVHWQSPWAQMKYFSFHPSIFPNMVSGASADATDGDLVSVYDRQGEPFGAGFYNSRARVPDIPSTLTAHRTAEGIPNTWCSPRRFISQR